MEPRDHWLGHCEGFRVDSPEGRVGLVEGRRRRASIRIASERYAQGMFCVSSPAVEGFAVAAGSRRTRSRIRAATDAAATGPGSYAEM